MVMELWKQTSLNSLKVKPFFPFFPLEYIIRGKMSPLKVTEQLVKASMEEPYAISRLRRIINEYGGNDSYGIPGHREITCSQVLEDMLQNRRLFEDIIPLPVQPDWSTDQLGIWERIFNNLSQRQGTFGICGQAADYSAAVWLNKALSNKLAFEPTIEKYMFDHTAPENDLPNMVYRSEHSDVIEVDQSAVKVIKTQSELRRAIHQKLTNKALLVAMFLDFAQYGHYTHWMACPAIIWAKKEDLPRLLSTTPLRQLIKTKQTLSFKGETEWIVFMGDTDPYGLAFETPAFLAPFDKAAQAIINVLFDMPMVKSPVQGNLKIKDVERERNENAAWLIIK